MLKRYIGLGWIAIIVSGIVCLIITIIAFNFTIGNHFNRHYLWILWLIWLICVLWQTFGNLAIARKKMKNKKNWIENKENMKNNDGFNVPNINDNSVNNSFGGTDMSSMMNNLMKGNGIPSDFFNGNMPVGSQNKSTKKITINGKEISHECNGDPNCSECKKIDAMMNDMMKDFKF